MEPQVEVWAARAAELRAAGASEETVEAVRRLTAPARHKARIDATVEAAHASLIAQGHGDPEDYVAFRRRLVGIIIIDLIGVGGRQGATGEGTRRLPCFRDLGTGRKQAGDGGAWMAAAEDALFQSCERFIAHPILSPVDGDIAIEGTVIDVPPEWRTAVALRALAGLCVPHPATLAEDDTGWAAVAAKAALAIAQDDFALPPLDEDEEEGNREFIEATEPDENGNYIRVTRHGEVFFAEPSDDDSVIGEGASPSAALENLKDVICARRRSAVNARSANAR